MVEALQTAFGQHLARAVHAKGVILEGTFRSAPEAKTIVKTPVFNWGQLPVIARYSLFAGVPNLADNSDAASPTEFTIKIKATDGDDFDIQMKSTQGHPEVEYPVEATLLSCFLASPAVSQ